MLLHSASRWIESCSASAFLESSFPVQSPAKIMHLVSVMELTVQSTRSWNGLMTTRSDPTKRVSYLLDMIFPDCVLDFSQVGIDSCRRLSLRSIATYWVQCKYDSCAFCLLKLQRLFAYISGGNVPRKRVEMTAPVRSLVTPTEGPFCETKFTVSFFVPFDVQVRIPSSRFLLH